VTLKALQTIASSIGKSRMSKYCRRRGVDATMAVLGSLRHSWVVKCRSAAGNPSLIHTIRI
jgi:hypothetical protein